MNIPWQIGRYRVFGLLGKGAMGVVYRGRDDTLDRDVALKVMAVGQGADADGRARFQREARAAARLQHPNIVTIYELGEHEGSPFMAMELLDGVDLQRAIEGGLRPDPRTTLPIVLQLLAGLGHAHENGIVHRDVKPSNLFLPRGRPAKIMDFGVARLAGGTATGSIAGTPNYMSPEQVQGAEVDGRSDVFSSGLILYELVTGEKAYRADSMVALLYKIAHEDPDLSLIPRGPEWERLRRVLARSLARPREQRYPDARAMADELALALQDLGGSADWSAASDQGLMVRTPRPAPTPAFAEELPAAEAAPSVAVPPAPVPAPRPSRTWLGAAGAGAALALVLGFVLVRLFRAPAPAPSPIRSAAVNPSPGVATAAAVLAPTAAPPSASSAAPRQRPSPTVASLASPRAGEESRQPGSEADPDAATPPPGPAPAHARLDRANDLFEKGRYAAALAEAKAVLVREPVNAEAKALAEDAEAAIVVETRLRKAKEALRRGNKETAMEELKAALAVAPSDARLLALWREATQ